MVARGNPLRITSLADIARPGVRYVNRAAGTGTRVLLDELLDSAGLAVSQLQGYDTQEPSHTAVAQSIAAGAGDAGLGIAAAADSAGLGFVPLLRERYHLVCLKSELSSLPVQSLITTLQSSGWQNTLAALPGYSGGDSQGGKVLALNTLLPWWRFRRPKKADTDRMALKVAP